VNPPPLVFLVAGEPSGDQLGAKLMAALKAETEGAVRFAGVGGPRMIAEGLNSLFPMDDLTVMGFLEVVPHLRRILARLRETVAAAKAQKPDILVTIDAPGFSLEVCQRLKGQGILLVHYVAPTVWAWKAWRARKIAGYLDHLLAMFPFEPPYFERHGLATTVVGNPAVEAAAIPRDPEGFRARHGIPAEAPLIAVLPGSRRSEIKRLAPVFGEALELLQREFPELRAVVPTVPTVGQQVEAISKTWSVPSIVLHQAAEKYDAFSAADVAMAASGTVTVELAVAGLPAVIAYKVSPLSAVLARLLLKVRFAAMPNLVADRELMPELLQEDCRPDRLAQTLAGLLRDPTARAAQQAGFREVVAQLSGRDGTPSLTAARTVLSLVEARRGETAEAGA
jgi:lipid-A-disaccharide synthase